jgi:hypothetical protein
MSITWNEAKENTDKLTNQIEELLKKSPPKTITDILEAVQKIDKDTKATPNPNHEGQYCQLILYPSKKWNTWNRTSMSISEYNIYR